MLIVGDSHAARMGDFIKAQLMCFDTVRIRSIGGVDADRVEILHKVNLDDYDIIVLVVGCCRLYDRQGKRLTTPSQMTEKLTKLVEIAKGTNRKVMMAGILPKAVRCDVEHGLACKMK